MNDENAPQKPLRKLHRREAFEGNDNGAHSIAASRITLRGMQMDHRAQSESDDPLALRLPPAPRGTNSDETLYRLVIEQYLREPRGEVGPQHLDVGSGRSAGQIAANDGLVGQRRPHRIALLDHPSLPGYHSAASREHFAKEGIHVQPMSVTDAVRECFPFVSQNERALLSEIDASPHPSADGAAYLLGHDLHSGALRSFHERLLATGDEPPPLWRFTWKPIVRWNEHAWLALPADARVLRARAGSVMHDVSRRLEARTLDLSADRFARGLQALERAGLAGSDGCTLKAIASGAGIASDLACVELIVHWLRMIAHRERIVLRSPGNGFDVCGYAGACSDCRQRWGSIPRIAERVPPFHPGCRCFAQPRWTS